MPVSIAFPAAFTNADSINILSTGVNSFGNNRYDITIQRVSRSTGGCTLMVQYTAASTSIHQIDGIDWRALDSRSLIPGARKRVPLYNGSAQTIQLGRRCGRTAAAWTRSDTMANRSPSTQTSGASARAL
jgi:hypothetical protein